jgi:hypothetical protein
MHGMPNIPATVFTRFHSETAVRLAEEIFEMTEKFLNEFKE